MQVAAVLAVVLLAVIAAFQLALALGAPLGRAAFGGQHEGVLPTRLRVASGAAAVVIYPLIIALVLASAGIAFADGLPGAGATMMWAITAFFAVGTLANLASRSKVERVWGPVSLVIAVCCAIIAMRL